MTRLPRVRTPGLMEVVPVTLPFTVPSPARAPPLSWTSASSVAPSATVMVPGVDVYVCVIVNVPARTWKSVAVRLLTVRLVEEVTVYWLGMTASSLELGTRWLDGLLPATVQLAALLNSPSPGRVQLTTAGTARSSRRSRRRRAVRNGERGDMGSGLS